MIVPEQTLEAWQVSLRPSRVGEVPEGTAPIARAVFPNGCLTMRMRNVLGAVFTDDEFAAVFPSRGRPAISPALLAFVSVLQFGEVTATVSTADNHGLVNALGHTRYLKTV
jgi:hypothetical protein